MRRAGRRAVPALWLALTIAVATAVAMQTRGAEAQVAGAGSSGNTASTGSATPLPAPDHRLAPAIPYRKDDDTGDLAVKVVLGLSVSLVVAFAILFALRRYVAPLQRGPGRRMRLVESLRLAPKSTLFLVEVDQRTLLVGQQGDVLVVLVAPADQVQQDPTNSVPEMEMGNAR